MKGHPLYYKNKSKGSFNWRSNIDLKNLKLLNKRALPGDLRAIQYK